MCKGTSTNRKGERIGWEVSEGGEKAAWDAGEMEGESGLWSLWPGLGSGLCILSLWALGRGGGGLLSGGGHMLGVGSPGSWFCLLLPQLSLLYTFCPCH